MKNVASAADLDPLAIRVAAAYKRAGVGVLPPEEDEGFAAAILAFNTELAKLMQRLKKDAGAETIAQNYKGTGSRAYRRQLFVRFKSGAVVDLWLEADGVRFALLAAKGPPGKENPPKLTPVSNKGKTPEEVYRLVSDQLKVWAN